MIKKIPFLLIFSRAFIALLIILIALFETTNYKLWIVSLMTLGLLTDVFDGIIARKLNVSNEKLRIWDSNVDQFFWISVSACIFYLNRNFVLTNFFWIGILVVLELLTYIISYLKFKKTIATHSILAKIWTISLLMFLIDLMLNNESNFLFKTCLILGIISRLEIISIIIKLKNWTTDVPSIFSVHKLNKGKTIKKYKLFNS